MHKSIINICLLVLVGLFSSCTDSPLENALKEAGKNRKEMEKVLEHFSRSSEDSLKYKAACFLIEHMVGYGTYCSSKYGQQSSIEADTLSESHIIGWMVRLYTELSNLRFSNSNRKVSSDLESLSSDFLIEHIESVFRQKDKYIWLQDVDFDDFCEYLLPYRLDKENTTLWRDSLLKEFPGFDDNIQRYEDTRTSSVNLIDKLPFFIPKRIQLAFNILGDMDCRDIAMIRLWIFRSCGIPASIDMIPCWGNFNGNHVWAQPIEKRKHYLTNIDGFSWSIPKVYRRTYSTQTAEIEKTDEYIPPFFQDKHLKDVTNEYVYGYQVKEKGFPDDIHFGYLCVFSNGDWLPVAQAVNHSGECTFPDMGSGIVYLPVYYDINGHLAAISEPFRLKSTGEKVYLKALGSKADFLLNRKYPLESRRSYFMEKFVGTVVEASPFKDFHQKDTLGQVRKNTFMQPLNIIINKDYRFFKISLTEGCPISEIYFWGKDGKKIYGSTSEPNKNLQDDDILTYGSVTPPIISFSLQDAPSSLCILPFNDGNGIYPEDEYELCYFDKEHEWVSCGMKKAKGYSIQFENVPQGALYWLHNLTTGKEERIFTYENNRQRFW